MTAPLRPAAEPCLGFPPHLRVEAVPGEAVFLIADRRVTALHGAPISRLAPLLDGTRDLAGLRRECPRGLPEAEVDRLVAGLDRAGLLHRAPARPATPAARAEQAYWAGAGLDGAEAAGRLAAAGVHALALGAGGADLEAALTAAGLSLAGRPDTADLTVVLCEDYLDARLAGVDEACRAAGRAWLPVQVSGRELWTGPFFAPQGTDACWSCLADRLWRGRQAEAHVQRRLRRHGPAPRPDRSLRPARLAGLHLAALEAATWLAGHRDPHQSALWTLDTLTLRGGRHRVERRPQCPRCGDPGLVARRVRRPVVLAPRPKRDTAGGGHRSVPADEVLERYGHLVDPLTGLVTEIRRDRRGPAALNCFHAGHNPVTDPDGLDALRAGLRHTSSGKGVTETQARVSALCEALERHSGFFQGDEPVEYGRFADLADEAVHPDEVQLFHPRQFRDRERWNAAHAAVHRVCDPFDERARIAWTPVWSLTAGRRRLLPTAYLYYNAPQRPGERYCWAHSNGTAAGATVEDAVLQGTLELIERDAVALWWYNRTRQPGIDLDAAGDPYADRVRALHRDLHRSVWALDLTADLGVPVVAALSRRTDRAAGRGQDIVLGFGAHPDPAVALRRALTELNQMLPPVAEATAGGEGHACRDPHALRWFRTAAYEDLAHLRPLAGGGPAPAAPRLAPTRDVAGDVDLLRERLAAHGLELLVLDQTRPDVGLPVVRTIVPGLRPHWARLGPGRLYDVPVRLGRLPAPLTYDDLNPVPLFL